MAEPERCAICLEDLDEALATLSCSHSYHAACIEPWLQQGNRSCPTCRDEPPRHNFGEQDESDGSESDYSDFDATSFIESPSESAELQASHAAQRVWHPGSATEEVDRYVRGDEWEHTWRAWSETEAPQTVSPAAAVSEHERFDDEECARCEQPSVWAAWEPPTSYLRSAHEAPPIFGRSHWLTSQYHWVEHIPLVGAIDWMAKLTSPRAATDTSALEKLLSLSSRMSSRVRRISYPIIQRVRCISEELDLYSA